MIKSISILTASVVVLVLGGCATDRPSLSRTSGETKAVANSLGPKLETISYHWDSVGVDVTFTKGDNDRTWGVDVADSWCIYEHFKEQVWGSSSSKCSVGQCLELIDQSLTQFHAEKPAAKIGRVGIEMHVIRELWNEILTALKQELPTMEGGMSGEPADTPSEIYSTLQGVLDKSDTVAQVNALLKKHRLDAEGVSIDNQLMFKPSLRGQKWAEIGSLPDLGIEIPGAFEFDFGTSSRASSSGKSKVTVSQSAAR